VAKKQTETFQSMRAKFQFLYMKRKQEVDPWTKVLSLRCGGCTGLSRSDYDWQLYSRYITVYSSNPVRKEHKKDKLCKYCQISKNVCASLLTSVKNQSSLMTKVFYLTFYRYLLRTRSAELNRRNGRPQSLSGHGTRRTSSGSVL
jgi:hypothetical protein